MDVTFVQNAEDDINSHKGRQDQPRLVAERGLEGLRRALERGLDAERHVEIPFCAFNCGSGRAEGGSWCQIKGDGDGRELALVIDRKWCCSLFEMGKSTQGHR